MVIFSVAIWSLSEIIHVVMQIDNHWESRRERMCNSSLAEYH